MDERSQQTHIELGLESLVGCVEHCESLSGTYNARMDDRLNQPSGTHVIRVLLSMLPQPVRRGFDDMALLLPSVRRHWLFLLLFWCLVGLVFGAFVVLDSIAAIIQKNARDEAREWVALRRKNAMDIGPFQVASEMVEQVIV